eukprot:TRINITY_DN94226_c0_g1_i1.p1 TRINITY_DN94226_c0_g1~~TRINITY_DN94226_c0_g1_i1.p1  ORF type:complete len:485 (+),score=20.74 TRINITY_DN94226_c0_g1_i1:27-1457(+)
MNAAGVAAPDAAINRYDINFPAESSPLLSPRTQRIVNRPGKSGDSGSKLTRSRPKCVRTVYDLLNSAETVTDIHLDTVKPMPRAITPVVNDLRQALSHASQINTFTLHAFIPGYREEIGETDSIVLEGVADTLGRSTATLQTLDIAIEGMKTTFVEFRGMSKLASSLAKFKPPSKVTTFKLQLPTLSIGGDAILNAMTERPSSWCNISHLSLGKMQLSEEGATALSSVLPIMTRLSTLILQGCEFDDAAAMTLCSKGIAQCHSLTFIKITGWCDEFSTTHSDTPSDSLASARKPTISATKTQAFKVTHPNDLTHQRFGSPRGLGVHPTFNTNQGMAALCQAFSSLPNMTAIDLSCNPLDSNGAEYLAKALHVMSSLQNLCLSGTDIDDNGAFAVASSLCKHGTLTKLDISHTHCRGAIQALERLVEQSPALTLIDFRCTDLTDDANSSNRNCVRLREALQKRICSGKKEITLCFGD